jgi:hypothetical protein
MKSGKTVEVKKMIKKDEEVKIHFKERSFVHPSYIHYCMETTVEEWTGAAIKEAIRIRHLALLLPNIEAGVIVDVATGKRKYSYDDTTITIHGIKDWEEE